MSSTRQRSITPSLSWLRQFATSAIQSQEHPIVESVEILMHHLIILLDKSSVDESALLDLIGFEQIHQVPHLIAHKGGILGEWHMILKNPLEYLVDEVYSVAPKVPANALSQIRLIKQSEKDRMKQVQKLKKKPNSNQPAIQGFDQEIELLSHVGWDAGGLGQNASNNYFQNQSSSTTASLSVGVQKVVLPEGTTRHVHDIYEEYCIPGSSPLDSKHEPDQPVLLPIASVLPPWSHGVFLSDSPYLNKIQSQIFSTAFNANDNFMVCAPTGAGKTNVALLAVCRCIREWKELPNPPPKPNFKIVYLAPMKALVAEIVDKFSKKLKHLPIDIREFTADISIPRAEMESANVIVTVPEKWDILMRNLGRTELGSSGDKSANSGKNPSSSQSVSLLSQVRLMIIDEVHLLHEERGAVIESIVARTMQFAERNYSLIRFAALSATFPNYEDVARFLGISKANTFFFDSSFRPVPLEQTIVGVGVASATETAPTVPVNSRSTQMQADLINKVLAKKVAQILSENQQVMVFVHSRNDTVKTAETLIDALTGSGHGSLLVPCLDSRESAQLIAQTSRGGHSSSTKSSNRILQKMHHLIQHGITIHHAGMLRAERTLAENLFKEKTANILVCTATLAWGVNLPSRYVIIKGTSIWDSSVGDFKQIELMDILQIFGRAGRPQFDSIGKALLLTTKDKLDYFLRLMTSQVPIESRFNGHLPDALNAEIALGNVATLQEAVDWLSYTYLFVRFFKAPQKYGILPGDLAADPNLVEFRKKLLSSSSSNLNEARLIRVIDNQYASTDLGRVAAQFYVNWETAEMFASRIAPSMTDAMILELIGNASEFKQLKCREDELAELESISLDKEVCPVMKVRGGGVTSVSSKVGILIQTYISNNYYFQSSSLASDLNYVSQNAVRLFRALFEISLTRSVESSDVAARLLEWAKMVERRIWSPEKGYHFLRHFTKPPSWTQNNFSNIKTLSALTVDKLELKQFSMDTIFDMGGLSRGEIQSLTKGSPEGAKNLEIFLRRVPYVQVHAKSVPITSDLIKLDIALRLELSEWSDTWHGQSEPFHVFVSDANSEDVFYHHQFSFKKKDWLASDRENLPLVDLSTYVPILDESDEDHSSNPSFQQLTVTVISDRYVGLQFFHTIRVSDLHKRLDQFAKSPPTDLLDLFPLKVTEVLDEVTGTRYSSMFSFSHFNPIQTQIFHTMVYSNDNVLCGCPTGSGKTVVAELAMIRVFEGVMKERVMRRGRTGGPQSVSPKIIYIAPQKALARERMTDWEKRIGRNTVLNKKIVELTGDVSPDMDALVSSDVIITTPEKWDGITRSWRSASNRKQAYVCQSALVVIDEIHLLGQDRGAVLEMIASRMRLIGREMGNASTSIRFIGLSTALCNSGEIANWLGVHPEKGLFNFRPSVRPVPMTVHLQGFPEKHYCPRMATMNKPCLSAIKQYSPSKPVLIFVSSRRQTRLTAFDIVAYGGRFSGHDGAPEYLENIANSVANDALKQTLPFGIGIHHAGLSAKEKELVENLFRDRKIQVLVATSTLAVGINLPAHLVIVKGTEYYDAKLKRYVDMPITDVLQMVGRAGRPQFDSSAVAVVMVQESKKNFYRKFIYSPFPLESSLHTQLADHLNAEIAAGSVSKIEDAIELLSWTYFFRRLSVNPEYYLKEKDSTELTDISQMRKAVKKYISELLKSELSKLEHARCIVQTTDSLVPTKLGRIGSTFYLKHETVSHLLTELARDATAVMGIFDLALILGSCSEFLEFPMRHKDDEYNETLSKSFPVVFPRDMPRMPKMESPFAKAFLVQMMRFFPDVKPPVPDYYTDQKLFMDQSVRMIQAMMEILFLMENCRVESVINLLLLNQALAMGGSPWTDPLLVWLGAKNTKHKPTMEVIKQADSLFPKLVEMYHEESSKVCGTLSRPIARLLSQMPVMRVEAKKDAEKKKLVISVTQNNLLENSFAVSPLSENPETSANSSKRRRVAWWLLIATESRLVSGQRVSIANKGTKTVAIDLNSFIDTWGVLSSPLTVYLISDCYQGLDQQIEVV